MEQVISGGRYDALDDTTTRYNKLLSGHPWNLTEFVGKETVSTSGKIKNLRVKLDDSPGAGKHYDFTLMVNGAPTALTLEIADAATSGANTVNEIDVVAGDSVSLQCDPDNTPTVRYATWTSMFEGATVKESLILAGTYASPLFNLDTRYHFVMGWGDPVVENDCRQVCPTSGKIKNLYLELSVDPGTSPEAYRFTLRKNGVSQTLTVTITADDTTGNDTVNEVMVAAGDVLTMMVEPLNAPSVAPLVSFGMTFVADTNGESIMLGGTSADLHSTTTKYAHILSTTTWVIVANEDERYCLSQECTLKKLYVLLSAAPGDGKSYTFTLRKPGNGQADGNLTVTITGVATTTGNDLVNEDAIANDDYVDLECTPAGTPDVADAYWGLVSYRAPPGLENKSANMGSKMVAAGLI